MKRYSRIFNLLVNAGCSIEEAHKIARELAPC